MQPNTEAPSAQIDGGNAFPHRAEQVGDSTGMTLRAWYAGQLAPAITLKLTEMPPHPWESGLDAFQQRVARLAVSQADALIAELRRTEAAGEERA